MTVSNVHYRDNKVIGKVQKLRFNPAEAVGGKGVMLTESNGRQLLDMSAGWGAMSLGYGHPAICEAVNNTVACQPGAGIISLASSPTVELAEKLLSITPLHHDSNRVIFGHSGSDANECVVRAVRQATGRPRIIAFVGAYHGGSSGSMSISGHSPYGQSPDLLLLPYPDAQNHSDFSSPATILALLDHYFDTICPPDEVGALFLEPILADGGVIVPPRAFFQQLQELCRKHGILMVSDEVKVGLGRTGQVHGFQHLGITPDIVTFGKGLGAGLPISAAVGPDYIFDHAPASFIQTTHGNPVCAAAGLAMLNTLHSEKLNDHAAKAGMHMLHKIQCLAEQFSIIRGVSGKGLITGIAIHPLDGSDASSLARKISYRAYELGTLFYLVGKNNSVIELTPPLIIKVNEIDCAISTLATAIQDVIDGRVSDSEIAAYSGW